ADESQFIFCFRKGAGCFLRRTGWGKGRDVFFYVYCTFLGQGALSLVVCARLVWFDTHSLFITWSLCVFCRWRCCCCCRGRCRCRWRLVVDGCVRGKRSKFVCRGWKSDGHVTSIESLRVFTPPATCDTGAKGKC
ncbi:unnamed protein product, partial [Ectocarpus sp. 6 AP-2014]